MALEVGAGPSSSGGGSGNGEEVVMHAVIPLPECPHLNEVGLNYRIVIQPGLLNCFSMSFQIGSVVWMYISRSSPMSS